jgi:hypothetical protein
MQDIKSHKSSLAFCESRNSFSPVMILAYIPLSFQLEPAIDGSVLIIF